MVVCLALQRSKKNPQKFYHKSKRLTLPGFDRIMFILYNFELKHLTIPLEAYNRINGCRLFYKSSSNFNIFICLLAKGFQMPYSCYATLIHNGALFILQNGLSYNYNYNYIS